MKSTVSYLFCFLSVVLLFPACKDDCLVMQEEVLDARKTYSNNASNENCLTYQTSINRYLGCGCKSEADINYDVLFMEFLQELNCAEEHYYFRCLIDGENFEMPIDYNHLSNVSSILNSTSRILQINEGVFAANSRIIQIDNYDNLREVGSYIFEFGTPIINQPSENSAILSYFDGFAYYAVPGSGQLTIERSDSLLIGSFSLTVENVSTGNPNTNDTLKIENGQFRLPTDY